MAVTEKSVNGVDVEALEGAVDAISADSDVGMFTFRAETEWADALKSVTTIDEFDQAGETVHSRQFTIQGDEPEQILGERTGANAVELVLGALGSCLSVGYAAHAAGMGIEIEDLRFEMEGDIDLRGFLGISENVRPGYESISYVVHLDANASDDELHELQKRVEATSPLMDILQNEVSLDTRIVVE